MFRIILNDREDLHSISPHQQLRKMGANSLHHARREVFANSLKRIGRNNHEMRCLELDPPGLVVMPATDSLDMLTRGNGGNTAHNRYQITLLLYVEAQNSEPRRLAEKTNLFNNTGNALLTDIGNLALVHEMVNGT